MKPLFVINCLWIGNKLGSIEQVCLLSMLRHGHRVRLYGYEKIHNIPSGIEFVNGNEVLPYNEILRYTNGHIHAIGADLFRYKLQELGLGIWLDLDVLLLKPLTQSQHDIFGKEEKNKCNNAVLFLAKESQILHSLIKLVSTPYPIPPFFSPTKRTLLKIQKKLGLPKHVSAMRWGTFGPKALTHFSKTHNLFDRAQETDVFYPVHYRDAHGPLTANWDTEQFITTNTKTLHLWNEMLKKPSYIRPDLKSGSIVVEKTSFLENYAKHELGYCFN